LVVDARPGDAPRLVEALTAPDLYVAERAGDDLGVAGDEPETAAGHVASLRERDELDRHVGGSRYLEGARGAVAVERDVTVGETADDDHVMSPGEVDDVDAPCGHLRLQLVDATEDVLGRMADAAQVHGASVRT